MLDRIDPRNWTIDWSEVLAASIWVAVAVTAAFILHRLLFKLLNKLSRLSESPVDEMVFERVYKPMRWSMVAIALAIVANNVSLFDQVWGGLSRFVVPALWGWVALSLIRAFAAALEHRVEMAEDPVSVRSRRTRISILSRTASFAVIVITIGLILLGIPGVRDIGVTLMASAGLAALAIGAAAQPALKSLIGGLQMAITEPLRLGDLVVVDGHTGRVEEIRMSFVIIRTWDERAVVVPTVQFLDESFENWSRKSEKLTGPVFLHLDPATEVAPIRAEFERFLATQDLWDERTSTLFMTEAHPESIELRLAMSAKTIADLFALRCTVREHMIEWLRTEMPDALIRHRLEVEAANAKVAKA